MAYSDFKSLQKVRKEIGLDYCSVPLFPPTSLKSISPSHHLLFDIEEAKTYGLLSEKAKSEFIIAPILKEVRRKNVHKISFLSGVSMDCSLPNLNGICDFIFSKRPHALELETPIFCLVEAKNRTLEEGLGQCDVEMYAANMLNNQDNTPLPYLFGAVTNAYEWVFLKLENNLLYICPSKSGGFIGCFSGDYRCL
jgi:hypothetical protein